MPISVTCTACKAIFRVKDEHAGKRGKCPRCQGVIEICAPLVAAVPSEIEKSPPKPLPAERGGSAHLVMQEILDAFEGDTEPVRRTKAYGLGILVLTVCMVALPCLYLGLIYGIARLVLYHATENWGWIKASLSWWTLLFLYVAPLAVGVILLFFMVKPLLARRARSAKLQTLEFGAEPLLFCLVTRVAKAVGAPEPRRIALDCQANASASFGGALGFLVGGDLVLTLGLPLVAGLSIQQLAGVIAHELGHFSQGAGMRLSYVVRSINAWLFRVVYERDNWDDALVNTAGEAEHLLVIVVVYLAMLCIWLTRGILWLLMALGHALSCFMLRQMEYDADRHETRLTGADNFAATDRHLLALGLVSEMAFGMVIESWIRTGKLPDDFSGLIHNLAERTPPRDRRKIEKKLKKIKTGFFDTHPSHEDRVASVRRENAPGVFHLDGPATRLFKDFSKTSREATLDFYREALGKRLKPGEAVPVGVFLGGRDRDPAPPSPMPLQ